MSLTLDIIPQSMLFDRRSAIIFTHPDEAFANSGQHSRIQASATAFHLLLLQKPPFTFFWNQNPDGVISTTTFRHYN
ncbi:hypothetical protein LguiB_027972 [Lonicera macranthoides]